MLHTQTYILFLCVFRNTDIFRFLPIILYAKFKAIRLYSCIISSSIIIIVVVIVVVIVSVVVIIIIIIITK